MWPIQFKTWPLPHIHTICPNPFIQLCITQHLQRNFKLRDKLNLTRPPASPAQPPSNYCQWLKPAQPSPPNMHHSHHNLSLGGWLTAHFEIDHRSLKPVYTTSCQNFNGLVLAVTVLALDFDQVSPYISLAGHDIEISGLGLSHLDILIFPKVAHHFNCPNCHTVGHY